jgi:hypothetical protein
MASIASIAMDVHTKLQYLEPSSKPLRRYIAPGGAFNTGTFQWNNVVVRDARPTRLDFGLDNTGFCLVDAKSDVSRLPFSGYQSCFRKALSSQSVACRSPTGMIGRNWRLSMLKRLSV